MNNTQKHLPVVPGTVHADSDERTALQLRKNF